MLEIQTGIVSMMTSGVVIGAAWRVYKAIKKDIQTEIRSVYNGKFDNIQTILGTKSEISHQEICHVYLKNINKEIGRNDDRFGVLFGKVDDIKDMMLKNGSAPK